MPEIDHDGFMTRWREVRAADPRDLHQIIPAEEYELVMAAIDGKPLPEAAGPPTGEPKWLTEARRLMGTREIVGPRHNRWIAEGWGRLGARWFNDDETPWCGLFVAHCLDAAGFEILPPSQFPRAKAWLNWGKPCAPCLGAVVVFGRNGGGHVGFLVGESASHWYTLGGNQSNAVNIMPIAKLRALDTRWPGALSLAGTQPLPKMSGGTVSRNEA